jgi:hypothetical protein
LSSSIIYQLPNIDSRKYKCYEFPKIEEAIYQQRSISIYEIPQYIKDIPEGFSIFCTLWEAGKVKQYMRLSKEEQDRLGVGEKEKLDKSNDVLEEPVPMGTNFCHLCRRKFEDYLTHINSMVHKNSISKNQMVFTTAKNTFKRITDFWNKNNNNNNINNINNINEKIDKSENNKLYGRSISSFSSAVSTLKCEEPSLKDINSFLLEPELSDIDKNNDKENFCDNKYSSNNKKSGHTKNKTYFVTPKKVEKFIEIKYSNQLSSSQSSQNLFINKKRKGNNVSDSGKISKFVDEEKNEKEKEHFICLNANKPKKLIRGVNVFFK